ncbi:MAG: hypothetical protein PQJ60_02165, partial [Spirochaetales bacterium]|nr:hypothetical protein [Spirochaetales bacterium]
VNLCLEYNLSFVYITYIENGMMALLLAMNLFFYLRNKEKQSRNLSQFFGAAVGIFFYSMGHLLFILTKVQLGPFLSSLWAMWTMPTLIILFGWLGGRFHTKRL